MARKVDPIVAALTRLGDAVKATNTSATTLRQQHGWNFPNLTSAQMALMAYNLRDRIDEIDDRKFAAKWDSTVLAAKIDQETLNTPPQLWNGNGAEGFKTYISFLQYIEAFFSRFFDYSPDWEALSKNGSVPPEITKRVRAINARIKGITTNMEGIDEKVATILSAHDAALTLPTDLEALEEARSKVDGVRADVERDFASVSLNAEKVQKLVLDIEAKRDEAIKLVERTEDAYSAATTMGLGAAFEARAKSLAFSMWVWVVGLFIALIAGGIIGWLRISLVEDLLTKNASATAIWINTLLSALSIAAPVWLAWIATKQIGQRFRLSEDYAFKASVAKAYEGYRREAARLDPAFANRLFGSALERLDEAPLRFVEHETDGSPWHEVFRRRDPRRAVDPKSKAQTVGANHRESVTNQNDEAEET